jgi:glucuronoarabinoxylan endo-1,4-beta-xylanase
MSLATTTFDDPNAVAFVGAAVAHDYDMSYDPAQVAVAKMLKLPVWQTEASDLAPSDPSIANALKWAINIHNHMTQPETNAWLYWAGILDARDSQTGQGLILFDNSSGTFTVPKRFYALGHFSKFIRPGYVRLDCASSPMRGVYTSAYKDPVAGKFVMVAINSNTATEVFKMQLTVSLQKMVKYTTTSATNMAMATVASSLPSGSVQVSVPPRSITTFVSQH